jgi:hypothetical protein
MINVLIYVKCPLDQAKSLSGHTKRLARHCNKLPRHVSMVQSHGNRLRRYVKSHPMHC